MDRRRNRSGQSESARCHLTSRDLEQELRGASVSQLDDVGLALLERDGGISVISKQVLEQVGPSAASPVRGAAKAGSERS